MIESQKFYQDVAAFCLKGVEDSYDPVKSLMNKQLRDGAWAPTLGTEELTSTAICLLGLYRSGTATKTKIDVPGTLTALNRASQSHRYAGGIGLIIWANAVAGGTAFADLLPQTGFPDLEVDNLIPRLTTMESAWLLSGLLHEYKRLPTESTKQIVLIVLAEVSARFNSQTALFRHATNRASIKERLRSHIANFADQIYSVQALSYAAIVLEEKTPLNIAKTCALRLIELQGPLGQWWWHYNSESGAVSQAFPVYSVHQHAMAPMTLMALSAAGGGDFGNIISLSRRWLGDNELAVNLLDREKGTIWRDIQPEVNRLQKSCGDVLEVLGRHYDAYKDLSIDLLRINYETRPYEWAWCLFAGAMAAGTPPPQFIA